VLWTAAEIGLRFEHEDRWATPEAPTNAPEFLALNPNSLVPVWQDAAGSLWESNTICRYLAASHVREDLLPAAPFERALVERWMDWAAGDLNLAWRYSFMALVRRDPAYRSRPEIERSVAGLNRLMAVLDGQLAATGAWVAGEVFTLADIAVGLAAHRWRSMPVDHADLAHVAGYLKRLAERPSFAPLATAELP
jgi:glutathione S-transferase